MDSDQILKLANEREDEQISILDFNRPSVFLGVSGQFPPIQHYSDPRYTQRTSLNTETVLTLIYTFMDG